MKTSLSHLPPDKQEEIQSITDSIVQLVQPEMIILFGSYSRGNWIEDVYKENGTTYEYKSDYDILVVTEHHQDMPPGLGKQVRKRIKKTENLQTTPHIIFHDIKFLNKELEEGHYFFTEIVKEGTMLYNGSKFELATPKEISPASRAYKAKTYFDSWFKDANDFLDSALEDLKKDKLKISIFLLHQSVERYFMTTLLVFTDYKPKTHDLESLNRQAGYADIRFKTVFPNQSDEEKRLFTLLVKAYIDSRYKMGYTISAEDLQWLADRVQKLKELTEDVCREQIKRLANAGSGEHEPGPRTLGVFQYDNEGFTICYEALTKRINWADITQLNVFKVDQMTIDRIDMEIVYDDKRITISEELPGWYQFVLKTKEVFPSIPKDWDITIIQPAFATNYRTIYNKINGII